MKCLTDGNVVWMSPSFCIGDLVKEERRNPSPCFLRDFTWVVLLCQVPILALPQRVEVRENYSLVSLPFFFLLKIIIMSSVFWHVSYSP